VTCVGLAFTAIYQIQALDASGATLRARSIMASTDGPKATVTLNMGVPITRLRVQVAQHPVSLRATYALADIALTVAPPAAAVMPILPGSEHVDDHAALTVPASAAPSGF